jgi:hypothetical protein
MGDSTLHDIKQFLQDVLSKVTVLEGKMATMEDWHESRRHEGFRGGW